MHHINPFDIDKYYFVMMKLHAFQARQTSVTLKKSAKFRILSLATTVIASDATIYICLNENFTIMIDETRTHPLSRPK